MSPVQFRSLQELTLVFSEGKASPAEIQQLSALLAEINHCDDNSVVSQMEHQSYLAKHCITHHN